MYIRWRKGKRKAHQDTATLSAFLVESKRINGQPRQHTLAALGKIDASLITDPLEQAIFWHSVERTFEQLALGSTIRQALRQKIGEVVALRSNTELPQLVQSLSQIPLG